MADTGYKNPSATGSIWNSWSSPTNAYVSDNAYAMVGATEKQDYYSFDFNIPSGANIQGIKVSVESYIPVTSNVYIGLSYNGGTNWTDLKSINVTGSEQYKIAGGSSDTWGRTWSQSEFSNANFRVYLYHSEYSHNLYVDHIRIKVYYTETTTSTSSSTSTSTSSTSTSSSSVSSSSSSMSSTSVSTSSSSISTTSISVSSTSVRYIPEIKEIKYINN